MAFKLEELAKYHRWLRRQNDIQFLRQAAASAEDSQYGYDEDRRRGVLVGLNKYGWTVDAEALFRREFQYHLQPVLAMGVVPFHDAHWKWMRRLTAKSSRIVALLPPSATEDQLCYALWRNLNDTTNLGALMRAVLCDPTATALSLKHVPEHMQELILSGVTASARVILDQCQIEGMLRIAKHLKQTKWIRC